MKRALCGAALIGTLMTMASCAGTEQLFAGGTGMFLRLGPATLGFGNMQQGWLAMNSVNWAGGQYAQQGYPVTTYPQQTYDATGQAYGTQTYPQHPQQAYDATGQAYGAQNYPQQAYDPATGQPYVAQATPQQAYDPATGQPYVAQAAPPQAYDPATGQPTGQVEPMQQADAAAAPATAPATVPAVQPPAAPPSEAAMVTVPGGPGLASLTTEDPAAAEALAQACASGQAVGPVTVRQVQPDSSYQDIQLDGVNLTCGSPAAGGQPGEDFGPGDEAMMTFSNAKVVNKGKVKLVGRQGR